MYNFYCRDTFGNRCSIIGEMQMRQSKYEWGMYNVKTLANYSYILIKNDTRRETLVALKPKTMKYRGEYLSWAHSSAPTQS